MNTTLENSIMLMTDAYKLHHHLMYPKNTRLVYSNATPRGGRHRGDRNQGYVIAFGMQRLVRKMQEQFQEFFDTDWGVLDDFLTIQLESFTGSRYSIDHIKQLHELQYIPMTVKALPEGTKCPYGVPYMTMYNTKPEFFWLTNYLETWMSCEQWDCVTSATTAHQYKQIFDKYANLTSSDLGFTTLQGHDFSLRGQKGIEAGSLSGLGHLLPFCGSDTVPAYLAAQKYYDSGLNDFNDFPNNVVATSVPASEHSVASANIGVISDSLKSEGKWGKYTLEFLTQGMVESSEDTTEDFYKLLAEKAKILYLMEEFPTGILSIVCDTYDFWAVLTKILPSIKDEIMSRDGKIIARPDSGIPADIICGEQTDQDTLESMTPFEQVCLLNKPENKGAIEILWDTFGGTVNEKGYKELDSHIGLIYGDSITLDRAEDICERLQQKGFASTNWVAGIGSYTYQMVTRDTDGQAFKATYIELDISREPLRELKIQGKEIYKDPKTGDGSKKSAKGLLCVEQTEEGLILSDQVTWEQEKKGILREIFVDGKFKNQETLFDIRKRLKLQ